GEGKGGYFAAISDHLRLYLGRASGVRREKRPRIFLETRRRDQVQARRCATNQSRDREYAKTKCADRDRFCAALTTMKTLSITPPMKTTPQSFRCRGSRAGCNSLILAGDTPATTIAFNPFRTKCFGLRCVLASFLGSAVLCASSFAQTPDSVAEREVQRRQAGITQGEAALARGQAAMRAKDYGAAHEEFRTAITYLPDAVVSGKAHDEAVEGFCKSGV